MLAQGQFALCHHVVSKQVIGSRGKILQNFQILPCFEDKCTFRRLPASEDFRISKHTRAFEKHFKMAAEMENIAAHRCSENSVAPYYSRGCLC